jgi:hypothetical protein
LEKKMFHLTLRRRLDVVDEKVAAVDLPTPIRAMKIGPILYEWFWPP